MYRPMGDESCSEHVRLTVKHTFIEFQCLDEDSPKLQRCNSDPCLQFAALYPPITSLKLMEALTPTTCSSVHSDDNDESAPPSPTTSTFTNACDGADCDSGHIFSFGSHGLSAPAPPPPPPAPPHFSVHEPAAQYQPTAPFQGSCAPMSVFSTSPPAVSAAAAGRGNNVRATAQSTYQGISADNNLEFQTTLMVRNLSPDLTQAEFLHHLVSAGYRGLFDLIYMPMNLRAHGNFGYAFVNFKSHTIALQVMARMQRLESGDPLSSLEWNAMWSTCQGFAANVDRYRNSPLMHELVPKDCKPSVYDHNGHLAMFPKPTKAIPKPRIHRPRDVSDGE